MTFRISPTDTTLKARLKMAYLVPYMLALSCVCLPIIAFLTFLQEGWNVLKEVRAMWTHKPLTIDQQAFAALLNLLRG